MKLEMTLRFLMHLFLLAFGAVFSISSAHAVTRGANTASVFSGFHLIGSPDNFIQRTFQINRPPYENGNWESWYSLLDAHGLSPQDGKEVQTGNSYLYDLHSAVDAFERFSETVESKAYQKWWMSNQDKILVSRDNTPTALTPPPAKLHRLQEEYDYHLAARAFYTHRSNPETLSQFRTLAYTKDFPRQKDAIRTFIHLQNEVSGTAAAWAELDKLQKHPATKDVYPYVEDLRFILIDHTSDDAALKKSMLEWLLRVIKGQDKGADIPVAQQRETLQRARFGDALTHLSLYLSTVVSDTVAYIHPENTSPLTPRRQAVKDVLPHDNLLAWLQLKEVQPLPNLYRLYDEGENASYVKLARFSFEQYQQKKGREWLVNAVRFARPEQPEFKKILQAGKDLFEAGILTKTTPHLQALLWQNLVWMYVESGQYQLARELLNNQTVHNLHFQGSWDYSFIRQTQVGVMEWFINKGDYPNARLVLRVIHPKPYDLKVGIGGDVGMGLDMEIARDTVIIAETKDELFAALAKTEIDRNGVKEVFNLIPRATLMSFIKQYESQLKPAQKVYLARLVFTRAWLLKDAGLMRESALLIHKYSEGGDSDLLKAIDGSERDRLLYVLTHPRMRPMVSVDEIWYDEAPAPTQVDRLNHNDNNWWCSYKPEETLLGKLDLKWALMPSDTWNWRGGTEKEQVFAKARAQALAAHPLKALIDNKEQEQLGAIPNAPKYLTERVIAEAGPLAGFLPSKDDTIPHMLHLAVRTTRYGCDREGSHQSYSYSAYRILHKRYPQSIWTQATPYWFGCGGDVNKKHLINMS